MNLSSLKPILAAGPTTTCGVLNDFFGQNLCDTGGDLNLVISRTAMVVVGLIGSILTIVILYCAIEIVTSGGSQERIKSAKNRLTQAAVSLGLLISFTSIINLFGLGGGKPGTLFDKVVPLGFKGVEQLMVNAMQILMTAVGAFSVIFIIVGGIQYIIAAGGSGVETAKKTITYAVGGLMLALSATAIIQLINQIFFT